MNSEEVEKIVTYIEGKSCGPLRPQDFPSSTHVIIDLAYFPSRIILSLGAAAQVKQL